MPKSDGYFLTHHSRVNRLSQLPSLHLYYTEPPDICQAVYFCLTKSFVQIDEDNKK